MRLQQRGDLRRRDLAAPGLAGLTANRKNLLKASGLYPAFDVMSLFASTIALL
jgi:hypothetical protein